MTASDEAKKALEGVTPGPWHYDPVTFTSVWGPDGKLVHYMTNVQCAAANARFIAWSRGDDAGTYGVPALLAEIAAKDAEIARLREALAHTADKALAAEIPVGYGPEDKGAWCQGYDAAMKATAEGARMMPLNPARTVDVAFVNAAKALRSQFHPCHAEEVEMVRAFDDAIAALQGGA